HRRLFADNPLPLWVYDAQTGLILAANPSAGRQYGYPVEEFVGLWVGALGAEDGPATPPAPEGEAATEGRFRHRTRDGNLLDVDVVCRRTTWGGADACLCLAHDVTEQRRVEDALREAQKLETIGRLAGGVAHDFNNLLMVINGQCELLLLAAPPGAPQRQGLEAIERAGAQAAEVTRQLLAYGRRQVLQPRVTTLNEVVREAEPLLRRLIGEDIAVELVLTARPWPVRVDVAQTVQAVLNLAANARDAMPAGGRLTLRTANVEAPGRPDLPAGPCAVLSVEDDGEGMPPEVLARVFEPFFTTKGVGRGTGLGLSTVYGMTRQSGGAASAESEPGRGSAFRIWLPRHQGPAGPGETAPEPIPAGSGELVLVVEDAPAVRDMVCAMLEDLGYGVLRAADPGEALALAADRQVSIDLLVTDVVMPGMDGPSLARRLRETRPGLPALLISGYPGETMMERGAAGTEPLLVKPFTRAQLAARVRGALGKG
ncbi:MAG: ATP-binding protein, partial [Deferrisomatales bacterium]